MPSSTAPDLPVQVAEILRLVDPLRRPQPFELDAALRGAIDALPGHEQSELALDIAEWLLPRCTTCDVAYTFNVLALADFALRVAEAGSASPLVARAHLVAARACAFHQPGRKSTNLARAAEHLGSAARAGGAVMDSRRWAATLLDVARAGELAGDDGTAVDHERLYAELARSTAPDALGYRNIAAARAADNGPAGAFESSQVPDIDLLEQSLEHQDGDILPLGQAPAATRLGLMYLSRAERGDGNRARYWLQAAERSFYYHPPFNLADYARNQLALARYFSVVSVNDPDDEEYVFNKGLFSLEVAYRLAGDDVDLQAECFVTAARSWAQRDPHRAAEFLANALDLEGLTPAARGRVELEYSRSLAGSPTDALAACERAIALLGGASDADEDRLTAMLFKARLLVARDDRQNPRDVNRPLPVEAIALMRDVAGQRASRGDLHDAYSIYRTLARWSLGRGQLAAALPHYEECRRVARLILDRDLRASGDRDGNGPVDDERRAALIDRPPSTLVKARKAQEVAVQTASVDHLVAAYCAAKLGRLDEALEWTLGSRLRNFFLAGRIEAEAAPAPRPAADQIVAVPIVGDDGTIVLLYCEGQPVEALPLPLTHAQLRRMVFADPADPGYDAGWVTIYREFERETPFVAPPPADHIDEPDELWWHSLKDEIERFGRYFAEPLLTALAERGVAAPRLLLVPSGLLSFMPFHAVGLRDGTAVIDRCALQLGFTPSLPRPQIPPPATDVRAALVVRGDNDLVYTGLETRTIAALLGARSVEAGAPTPRRTDVLDALERAAYVHFASHGVFDSSRWIDSRLELGMGEAITLRDVVTRDLSHVRLVTLSACESGVSHLTGLQEEFLGFPIAFAAAGAHAVLGTLWRVSDLSSALLLEAFYRRYLEGVHAAVALNDARKWLRSVTAGELVRRAREELAAPKNERKWRPIECAGVIGRFEGAWPAARPFQSPYHWAAFTLWQTD